MTTYKGEPVEIERYFDEHGKWVKIVYQDRTAEWVRSDDLVEEE